MLVRKKKNALRDRGTFLFILFSILVPTIHFAINYVYVNFNAVMLAFYHTVNGVKVWDLSNFQRIFTELASPTSELYLCLRNTFKTWIISVIIFPSGLITAYFFYKKIPFTNLMRICFFIPAIIAGIVSSACYIGMLSPEGWIAEIVQKLLGLEEVPEILGDERFANAGIWGMMIWFGLPSGFILWGGTMARIPDSLTESATLDGITAFKELIYVVIPLCWPLFSLQLLFLFSGILGASGNVFFLTEGNFGTNTVSNWMYLQVYNVTDPYSNAFNYMSAVGLIVTFISTVIVLITKYFTNKIETAEF